MLMIHTVGAGPPKLSAEAVRPFRSLILCKCE